MIINQNQISLYQTEYATLRYVSLCK